MISFTTLVVFLTWTVLDVTTGTTSRESCTKPAQGPVSLDELKKTIHESFICEGHPGMVVVVLKKGKKILSESYGETFPGSGVNITQDTKFMISSLTKGFTVALLANVFANNPSNKSYGLDQPLREILGDDFRFIDEQRTKYGTAEDILSHRIGLPNTLFMRINPLLKRSDFLYFPRLWKSVLPFRGTPRYSSATYTVAAAITEKVGGQTWEALAKERLLDPLGMTDSGFASTTNFSDENIAKLWRRRTGVIDPLFTRVYNSRCGSGCIVSTANDMTKWLNFMLTGGKNMKGVRVLPRDEVKTLTMIRTYLRSSRREIIRKPSFPVTSTANTYALAWRTGYYEGYKMLSHTGSSPGVASMIMLYPNKKMGIFVAMSGDDSHMYYRNALVHYISDYLLGQTPWLNASTICSFPSPWMEPMVKPSTVYDTDLKPTLPYINYIGTYKHADYGELFINFNQTTFSLQALYGVGSWQLFPQNGTNVFHGRGMWVTNFWNLSGWKFITADDNPKNITRLTVAGMDKDHPFFEKVFS